MKAPRPGQDVEILISAVQRVLSEHCVVTSNVKRYDHEAKCDREIDIAVEHTVGDRTYFTMIEVKDHGRRVGADTVEQVAGVRDGVRADVAVIVARRGFSEPARAKADAKNVRLRTFRDLTAEDWLSAFLPQVLNVEQLHCEPRALYLFAEGMRPLVPGGGPISDDWRFLDATGKVTDCRFAHIVGQLRAVVRAEHLENFDPHGSPQEKFALSRLNVHGGSLCLRDADGVLQHVVFAALVGIWHVEHGQAPIRANKYGGPDARRGATVMEAEFALGGIVYDLQAVIPDPKDGAAFLLPISVRLTPRSVDDK